MAAIVTSVSAVDLLDEINRQFDVTLKRSLSARQLALNAVRRSLNPKEPAEDSIRQNEALSSEIKELSSEYPVLLNIAVCGRDGTILADTDDNRVGKTFVYANDRDFEELVTRHGVWRKLQVLLRGIGSYQVSDSLLSYDRAARKRVPVLTVRVVVVPALIRSEIMPALQTHAEISIASIVGAMLAALIFSTIAFRPLGKLGHMLDLLAKGEYQLQQVAPARKDTDQFGLVASKVNLLGEQLRGAQSEISDLKDNFERLLDGLHFRPRPQAHRGRRSRR